MSFTDRKPIELKLAPKRMPLPPEVEESLAEGDPGASAALLRHAVEAISEVAGELVRLSSNTSHASDLSRNLTDVSQNLSNCVPGLLESARAIEQREHELSLAASRITEQVKQMNVRQELLLEEIGERAQNLTGLVLTTALLAAAAVVLAGASLFFLFLRP